MVKDGIAKAETSLCPRMASAKRTFLFEGAIVAVLGGVPKRKRRLRRWVVGCVVIVRYDVARLSHYRLVEKAAEYVLK